MKSAPQHKQSEAVLVLTVCVVYWLKRKVILSWMAVGIGLSGLLLPAAGALFHYVWAKPAEEIGFVVSRCILTLIFLLIVIPFGWIARKASRSSILSDASGNMYYKQRNHQYQQEDLENPW